MTEKFCETITADHYVFCSDGSHDNPDMQVLNLLVKSRKQPGDNLPFKFWFNSSSKVSARAPYMKKVEERVEKLANDIGARMTFQFLEDSNFEIDLGSN